MRNRKINYATEIKNEASTEPESSKEEIPRGKSKRGIQIMIGGFLIGLTGYLSISNFQRERARMISAGFEDLEKMKELADLQAQFENQAIDTLLMYRKRNEILEKRNEENISMKISAWIKFTRWWNSLFRTIHESIENHYLRIEKEKILVDREKRALERLRQEVASNNFVMVDGAQSLNETKSDQL